MKPLLRMALFGTLIATGTPAWCAVDASLDRDQIATGETVELTIVHGGGGEPDLGPLKKDFEVVGKSSGSSIRIVNGSMSREEQVRVTLAPRHAGNLQVPALTWDGEQSSPLSLAVVDGSAAAASGGSGGAPADASGSSHVYLTSTVDQKQPYVQGAVLLTVRLHTDQQLVQPSLDFSGDGDVSVQQIGKDQSREENNGGHRFLVIERRYLLQPQRSGMVKLEGPIVNAQVEDRSAAGPFGNDPFFRGMMGGTRPLRLHGDAISLDVRPRPQGVSGAEWLPARHISLEAAWHPDKLTVHAGEPMTLHLRLAAEGLSGAQLPDLAAGLALPDGVKSYPDQGKFATELVGDGILGSREQDVALIASQPGKYRIPSVSIRWWDIGQDVQREINLPERELEVLPVAGSPASEPNVPPVANPATGSGVAPDSAPALVSPPTGLPSLPIGPSPWFWSSLGLAAAWVITLFLWWRSRRRLPADSPMTVPVTEPTARAGAARKDFLQACSADDPQGARRHLLLWARITSGDSTPAGLNALAVTFREPTASLLRELDRACACGTAWHGDRLGRELTELPAIRRGPPSRHHLAPLYP